MVLVLRTLFGFGMGAEWTAGAALAMENWPARSRDLASGVLQAELGDRLPARRRSPPFVVPALGWRAMFLIAAVPALFSFPLMWLVKEPPRPAKSAQKNESSLPRADPHARGAQERLIWGSAAMAFGFGAYYGLTGLYSPLLKGFGQDMAGVSFHVALFNVGMMLGAIGCGALAMKKGVAPAILIPTLSMALCIPLYVGAVPAMLAIGAFLGGLFGAGYSGTTPLLLTSLFPEHLRAKGVGLVYHLGAVPAAFVPMAIAALSEQAGLPLGTSIGLVVIISVLGLAARYVAFGPDEVRAKPPARKASVH